MFWSLFINCLKMESCLTMLKVVHPDKYKMFYFSMLVLSVLKDLLNVHTIYDV